MKYISIICCSLFSLIIATLSSAQERHTVTGRVIDEAGQPIIGATVLVEGTNNGALTGTDGDFSLTITSPGGGKIAVFHPWIR